MSQNSQILKRNISHQKVYTLNRKCFIKLFPLKIGLGLWIEVYIEQKSH